MQRSDDMTKEQQRLVEENHGLIFHILKKYHFDIDEYYGTAAVGLCNAAERFNPEHGAKFGVFACECIKNEIFRLNQEANRLHRKSNIGAVSFDNTTEDFNLEQVLASDVVDPEEEAIVNITISRMRKKLNDQEKEVFDLLINHKTLQECSRILGISKQRVHQVKKQIQKKCKKEIESRKDH